MTSKVKGQPKRGSLADMTIYPNDDCHEQPPQGDVESMPTRMDLDDGHRLDYTRYYRRGTSDLVYFGINQSIRVDDDSDLWSNVARIDCSHGEVHRHQFTRTGLNKVETLEPITPRHDKEIINRWYERAQRIMQEGWTENLRRWEG